MWRQGSENGVNECAQSTQRNRDHCGKRAERAESEMPELLRLRAKQVQRHQRARGKSRQPDQADVVPVSPLLMHTTAVLLAPEVPGSSSRSALRCGRRGPGAKRTLTGHLVV